MQAASAVVAACSDGAFSPGRLYRCVRMRLPGVMRGVVEGGGVRGAERGKVIQGVVLKD